MNSMTRPTFQISFIAEYRDRLEVFTADRPGLLSRIGRIFAQFEINVHNAKIANIAERVEDFFYLTNADNQPITDPDMCEQLTSEICKELDQHMQ